MSGLRRKIGAERTLLMLPLNVILAARVRGHVDASRFEGALGRLRARHRLMGVRVVFEPDGTGYFVDEGVPDCPLSLEARESDGQWLDRVDAEARASFPIETGPLLRCVILRSEKESDIILTGHHAICDGRSLGFLLRDLLAAAACPETPIEPLPAPPPIDRTTAGNPARANPIERLVTRMINRSWVSKGRRFSEADMLRMHLRFWERHPRVRRFAWQLERGETERLVGRCREEGVTVNTALWAAFLSAQARLQPDRKIYRDHSALAVSTRDRLSVPVGEEIGFYASSLSLDLPLDPERPFWETARDVHYRVGKAMEKTDLFRMLVADSIHPTLLDSLYFAKYDGLDMGLPRRLLGKMGWDRVSYGYALTNVGRLDIPTEYGPLEIVAVHGPSFFSDVEEKVVGVITVGGRLSALIACDESVAGEGVARKIGEDARRLILLA